MKGCSKICLSMKQALWHATCISLNYTKEWFLRQGHLTSNLIPIIDILLEMTISIFAG